MYSATSPTPLLALASWPSSATKSIKRPSSRKPSSSAKLQSAPRKCRALLTRIVYLLYVGENFNTQEATTLLFGATKLFQPKDSALRQAVYLTIKELATTTENVIRLPSSIQKDMQPNAEVIYRPNAIRALCHIIDPSMAQGVQRFFKAVIVDRNPSISSASLILFSHCLLPSLFFNSPLLERLLLSRRHPSAACNVDLESLIADQNRSVATYDITTTLLQTGHEASVDCLIKQMITSFMSEIRKSLSAPSALFCHAIPAKHAAIPNFLSGVLRDEGGYGFKRVSAVASPRGHWGLRVYKTLYSHPLLARSQGAQSFPTRQIHSFHLLSRCPGNAAVRAAAVSSLAKFGLNFNREALNQSVGVLSRRCLDDVDDEVRDRAAMYLKVFRKQTLAEPHVKDGLSLAALESKHVAYVKDSAASAQAFEVSGTPQDQPCSNHRRRGCPTQLIG
ncbi:Coatomer subunit gamma [Mycena indigotica]|uniref:Coatomer subunit gamma n=1 Tax=Mycena indigotica TaxID=2126181 RepID=A0A8H6SCK0_9AGAR|nr:Coatomer subunit gamma [Mycena indigotica]KAF7297050.1 Coatomer subunit gamma [Mycena indigotica]